MIKIKHTFYTHVLFLCLCLSLAAAPPRRGSRTSIDIGPAFGLYRINTNHAQKLSPRFSGNVGFKREFRAGNDFKTYLTVGIDYFFHGLNFNSYYFKPDSIKLYDKSFAYHYSLFIHELNLPVQFKYLLKREDNSLYSPYIAVGYHLRYLLPGSLKVRLNDQVVRQDNPEMKFRTPLLYDKLNAFVSASVGWQRNGLNTSIKGIFFAELNFRYGFSQYSFTTDYAASSLYMNAMHFVLQAGLKF